MKSISEQRTFCKCSRRLPVSGKSIIAAALAAMMLLSLAACGKVPPTGSSNQDPSAAGNAGGTVEMIPSTDTDSSPDASANDDSAADDAWKAAFEKSLLKTTASSRIIMRNWKTVYIRST